ncbi:MAG: cobamide remodeling phosphodiesterase CbiR [Promethearchaeota archaeon]
MKFGITPINFDAIDADLDLRNLKFPLLVEKAINAGFKHLEITMDLEYVLPTSLSKRIIKKLLKIKNDNSGISYSVHLPLWSTELAGPNVRIRDASVQCMVECIERTKMLDPVAYVLHLTGSLAAEFSRIKKIPLEFKNALTNVMNGFASESIQKILKKVDVAPEKIAVENIEFPFEATRKIIDKYDLSICYDTGHLICGYDYTGLSVQEFFEKHMDRIIEIHLNDGHIVDGRPDDHIAIGDGSFPIDAIGLFRDKGFNGPLVFELTFKDALKSVKIIKDNYPDLKI